ncbi:MAG TPA: hypothetical protein VN408_03365 [Actinoplanes sp.]|nr:hypothetical protein [Actinoplanes sp.]
MTANRIAADTGEMRSKVPTLQEAANLACKIGTTLNDGLAANEPIAAYETDEVTKNFMPMYGQVKEFVGQLFELLPEAVGGDSAQLATLSKLLDAVEAQNAEDADRPVVNAATRKAG